MVGICCALSSTAVVVTVLRPSDLDAPEGRSIVGVLVMQDVLVGLLLAAVPLLLHPPEETLAAVALMGKNLVIFTVIAVVAARVMSSMAFRCVGARVSPPPPHPPAAPAPSRVLAAPPPSPPSRPPALPPSRPPAR